MSNNQTNFPSKEKKTMGFNPGNSRNFIKSAAINAGINLVEDKLGQHNIKYYVLPEDGCRTLN
jgi:hypothetical protein